MQRRSKRKTIIGWIALVCLLPLLLAGCATANVPKYQNFLNSIDYTSAGHVIKQTNSHVNFWFGDEDENLTVSYKGTASQAKDTYQTLIKRVDKKSGQCSFSTKEEYAECNGVKGMSIIISGYSKYGISVRVTVPPVD